MKPAPNPIPGTARQAVSRERASEIRLLTPNPPANKPTPTSHLETHPPSRRRGVRIAARFTPRPPQTTRESVSRALGSRKSLRVNRKIKAQPAKFSRP